MSPKNASEIGQRRNYEWRGQKLPSVTTLLKAWPMEWAIAFGAKHVAERAVFQFSELRERLDSDDPTNMTLSWLKAAPAQRRDAAADHGTNTHGYLEGRLRGVDVTYATRPLSPAEQAVEQFLAVYKPEPLLIESQVFSISHGYAGSADAFVNIYGRRVLLDLKTSATYDPMADRPNKAGGDHKDRLQLAAYRYADFIGEDDRELGPVPDVEACMVLAIPRDHPQAWRLIEVDAGPETFRRFLDFKRAFEFYDSTKSEAIGTMVLPQIEGAA
jgi:hypothetical protein